MATPLTKVHLEVGASVSAVSLLNVSSRLTVGTTRDRMSLTIYTPGGINTHSPSGTSAWTFNIATTST
jgi:hypothetical protein